jgi:predicted PurR-regulated permease PerM
MTNRTPPEVPNLRGVSGAPGEAALPARRKATLVTFLLLLAIFIGAAFGMVRPFLLAVLMGGILSILGRHFHRRLAARWHRPQLAALAVTASIVLLVIVPVGGITALAIKEGIVIGRSLSQDGTMNLSNVIARVSEWPPVHRLVENPAELETKVRARVKGVAEASSATLLRAVAQLPELLLQLALTVIACFFFLIDGGRFHAWWSQKIPLDPDVQIRLTGAFKETTVSTIWATLAAAAAQAALMLAAYLVLGVPAAFLAAGATFVFAWVPMVGSTPVWGIGVAYLFTQGSTGAAVAMLAIGIFTGVIDNYIRPAILKGRGEMHPLVSLVAIFGGIQMFGILGVFVGPILVAILLTLFEVWPLVGRRAGLLESPPDLVVE